MSSPEAVIVGGGVIGTACARALARRGVAVTLVDAGARRGAATRAAAGMLAPFPEAVVDDPLLGLSVRARDRYRELAPELKEETGVDIGLWTDGILQLAFTEDEVHRAKSAVAWQRQSGFASEWLSADELRTRTPGVSPDALGALLAPEDGALDPSRLQRALIASARAQGATVRRRAVQEIRIVAERVQGVRFRADRLDTGAVIIAAGSWSGRLKGLPRPLSVEPIRGQLVAFDWPAEEPPAIAYGAGGYVLARDGEAVAGTTMEHVGFDARPTAEGVARIARAARRIYPALAQAAIRRQWAGLRPMTPDGRPILGRDPVVENLWYATGHGRNGILLAAVTADVLASLYLGDEVDYDLTPLDPARFWEGLGERRPFQLPG